MRTVENVVVLAQAQLRFVTGIVPKSTIRDVLAKGRKGRHHVAPPRAGLLWLIEAFRAPITNVEQWKGVMWMRHGMLSGGLLPVPRKSAMENGDGLCPL